MSDQTRISYIVLAHKNIRQIEQLLRAIEAENVTIYLHIDNNAGNELFEKARQRLTNINRLRFLRCVTSTWGSFGLVRATLEGIHQIVQENDFDYVNLISGQDYPIQSKASIRQFFSENRGRSFLENYPLPIAFWTDDGGFDRINHWYFPKPKSKTMLARRYRNLKIRFVNKIAPNRRFPKGFIPYGGSQWWCLYKDCIEYIDEFTRNNLKFVKFFQHVRIPDELFFQTILMNSPLRESIINQTLTYVDWKSGPLFPRVLDQSDLSKLNNSGCLYARKFDIDLDNQIFSIINQNLLR